MDDSENLVVVWGVRQGDTGSVEVLIQVEAVLPVGVEVAVESRR